MKVSYAKVSQCEAAGYNLELSMQRASAVRDLLVKRGIKGEFMRISSHGEGNPLIPTDDNVAKARNRRSEVMVRYS